MRDEGYLYDPKKRFSTRVDNYVKYRPGYPKDIISFLSQENLLSSESLIADIGSGTGILSRLFLDNGNTVYGVEPNNEMRLAAEECLVEYPNFVSVNGSAEETNINDHTIDLISVGQAFHWFDAQKTRIEFERILKPRGYVIIIWNSRKRIENEFSIAYEAFVSKFGTDYKAVRMNESKVDDFFNYQLKTFENYQELNFEGLRGRLLSASYMPLDSDPRYHDMLEELSTLFENYQKEGKVRIKYETQVYFGHL